MNYIDRKIKDSRLTLDEFIEKDLNAICDLFNEKDFYFKTFIPNYLSEKEIFNLVKDAMVIKMDDEIIGVTEFCENMKAARHYSFFVRISNKISLENKINIIKKAISSYSKMIQIIKIATFYAEFDWEYERVFEDLDFKKEGSLEKIIELNGSSYSQVYIYKLLGEVSKENRRIGKSLNRFSQEKVN
ncbi:hypothetical protein QGM71_18245 [Virgibacillus sp. C22-A2]|uniref:N-acetyltransferase domain-containing protein n=1 Tax=Virgibacillus tibetensis TaxID=3042313 RepID=A0ABU6KJM5_9BACI|nr:hypothetical protein [Virgibacillus sp. C22-A2]